MQVVLLKEKTGELLDMMFQGCPGRTDLKIECSNLLLKAMLADEPQGYAFIGSLYGLSKLGPQMTI